MKKSLQLLALIFVLSATSAQTQNSSGVSGNNFLNAGIGLAPYTYSGLPFGASYEHGFSHNFSGGVFIDYLSGTEESLYKYSIVFAGVRASYHFSELLKVNPQKFDIYGGAAIGYHKISYSGVAGTWGNGVLPGLFAGARYWISPSFGLFAEAGYSVAALNVGVALKF